MDTSQEISKIVWDRIITDLGIPLLGNPKIKDIAYLRRKVNELLDSIPFEEDELLEAMDKEFVERWAKDLKLPIADLNTATNELDTRAQAISMLSKEELGKWSDEAYELGVLLLKLNYLPHVCNETYIRYYFKSFNFEYEKISTIGGGFKQFENLTTLNISHNRISVLHNLPPQLTELNVYENLITEVKGGQLHSLKHLGIGHNKLTSQNLLRIVQCFPELISLDVSYNEICDRQSIIEHLPLLKELKLLNMVGNPVTLLEFYRQECLFYSPNITNLDDVPIPKVLKKKKKNEVEKALPEVLKEYATHFPEIDVLNTVTMEIELRIADNIIGTEIPEELTADIENYEELEEGMKQSKFWISYDFAGVEYKTAEKLWKTDFQQLELNKGRCDFQYKVMQHIKPSNELRDQLQRGLLFKLWELKPVITQPKTEEEKVRVEMTPDNKIKQEQVLLGILKIELNTWITDVMNKKPGIYSKFKFYPIDLLTRPEYMLQSQVYITSLSEKDQKLMEEVAKMALEAYEKKMQEEAEQTQDKQKVDKTKKEVKKQPAKKGAKPTGPTTVEIEEIEAPEKPPYVVIEKNFKAGVHAYLADKNRAKKEAMKVDPAKKKKQEPTEEEKEKEATQEKDQSIKRIQKYFEVLIGKDLNVVLQIKMNGLEVKKEEEAKEVKKEEKSKKKDAKKEAKKAIKKK